MGTEQGDQLRKKRLQKLFVTGALELACVVAERSGKCLAAGCRDSCTRAMLLEARESARKEFLALLLDDRGAII